MIEPSINTLLTKIDSKYTLVVAVAKRARIIAEERNPETGKPLFDKTVVMAVNELAQEQLYIIPPSSEVQA